MKQRRLLQPAPIAVAAIAIGLSGSARAATNLNPFARNLQQSGALSLFHTAQAEEKPTAEKAGPTLGRVSDVSRPATATATATATTTSTPFGRFAPARRDHDHGNSLCAGR